MVPARALQEGIVWKMSACPFWGDSYFTHLLFEEQKERVVFKRAAEILSRVLVLHPLWCVEDGYRTIFFHIMERERFSFEGKWVVPE